MRQKIIIQSLLRRVSVPAYLVMAGLAGCRFCLFQLVSRGPGSRAADFVLPFVLLFGHLALALWTEMAGRFTLSAWGSRTVATVRWQEGA